MAPKVPGLFANPTTGFGGIGADKLQQARQDLANYQAPQIDRERLSGLIEGIGGFQQKQQQRARGFDLSELSQEFGLDTDIPVTDMSGPDTQSAFSEFLSDTMAAADQGYGDMGFGASLILNDNETNMMALEQNFQRTITAPPEELGFDQNSLSRFVDADWYANMIGGTLPSISTMIAGGAAGGAITAPTVVATPLGILGGATVGSGGGVALQTLGSTTKDAYIAYRQQGKSVEEAYDLAYADAKVDSAKSGALASVATLIAPLRFARGVGVTAAPAVGAKAIAGQFAQQSLIVQPTLEVADTISSNAIAQNSYDPNRVLSQGALDAFIGSVFFDVPTTAGGILISQMNGKNVPAFEPGTQLVPAPRLLTGPNAVDGEVMPPLTGPEPVAALPAPQFVIEQNEDGSWSVIDNINTDFRQNFANEEDAQFEATTRNDQILNNQIPAGFNPDSVSSRDAFLKSQIDRMEQYDANKRQANEKYTGDVRIRNTVAFFEWLRKADTMKAKWDQTYNTAAKRNTPSAIRQLADIQERIELTKIIMNPVRTTKLPNMIYQSKGGKPFRVVMDKNNRPLRPKDRQGNPKMNHVLIFDTSSKTGFRSVAISSGTLMDVSSPNPSNLLMTAPVYKRLMEARNAMLAEMRGQMQGQIEGQPAAQITDETQTPAALPYSPRFGEDQPGVTERGNERAEQPGTSRPDPNAPPDVIPLPDETQPEAETGRDPVETDTNELMRQRLGLSPAVIKDDEVTAASPDSVIDEAEAEAEIEYTIKTRRMRTPEGMVDEVQPPITSVADGGNIMYTMRLQMVGSSNYAWFLVDENGGEVARSGSAKTPGIPELPIGYTKDEAIAYMKNMLRERNEDPKFTRSRDAGQRGGATAFGEGVEAMLEAVPEQDRSNVRKVLMMFQQALGKSLDTVDVVDMATWLQNQDVVADDGNFVAAYLNNWVKQQSGGIQKGAIAISQGLSSPDAVRALAHELTHFTVKVKNISKDMMVEFYNSVPENDSIRQVIDSDPYYSQQSVEVRAEEVLAETLAQMLTNRYRGRLHQESTFKYMLRQIVRVVREAFEGITGRDTVDTFFANLAKQYGADTQATNPFMDRRDPVFDEASFARKTGDDGSTLPPEASKSMEDIQKNIPEHKRVARATQMGTQQTAVDGKRFIDKDLSVKGRGWIGKRSIMEIWEQAIANTPGGKEKLEMMKRSGIDMMPKAEEFWNRSFNREDRARYWYEISSEMFRATFPDATDAQLEQFIDLVGATSVQANPTDNILRAIAVFSEYLQGMPIETDLTDVEGVRKALSPEMLGGPKTRSFSGTMLYLLGKRAEVPLSTNDRQVATVFGVDGDVIANDYLLYELISNFYIGMRDEMNANLPPNAEPYETWQIQALGWVEERAEKNAAKNKFEEYDDYAMVIQNKVMPRLQDAGISVPNGQLTQNILKDTRIPFALRDTMAMFTGSSIATVETVSKLNPVGDRFATLVRRGRGLKGTVGMMKEADKLVKQSMASVALRVKGKPNAIDNLATAIMGKKTDLRRIDTSSYGTFEGEGNPNIRIPLKGMDASQRQVFLGILGRGLRQAAMAASVFKPADINQPPRPNHSRTFSVFIQTTEKSVVNEMDAESFDRAIGRPINVKRVANGYVFDINVGGYDPVTDASIVSAAVRKAGLDKKGTIRLLPRDYLNEYGFDFIEMDSVVDDDMQIGYNQIVENFIEELTNGAVQEAQGIDSRISEGGVRAYLRGDDKAEISDGRLPSTVTKRVERIRTRLRERVGNLRQAEVAIMDMSSTLEDSQAQWLAKHGDKLETLIANADPDDAPKFARSSLIPEADQTSDTDSITEEEFALFSRYLNMPESDAKTRMLEWMSRNWFTGVFTSSAQRIIGMGRGTKAAYKLANMFDRDKYGRTGRNETGIIGQDVHDEISERIAKFSTQFTEQVLKGLSPKQALAMAEIMRGKNRNAKTGAIQIPSGLGIPVSKARAMRKLMNDLYQEMVDAYESRGLVAPEKLPMYFPQRYSIDGKIHGVEGRDALVAFFTKVFEDRPNPRGKAEMLVQKIEDEGYQPTWGFDLAATLNQKAYNITPQELRRIIRIPSYAKYRVNIGGQTVDMTLADFLDNDTVSVTQNYIASTVRRTTFIRRFGAKGEDIQAIAGANGEIDQELINRGERPLTSSERESIFYAIRANMGILPRKSFFGATSGTGAYSFQNGMKLFGNMAFLSLSAIQSIAEPALIFSRTGMMGGLAGVQQLAKSTFLTPVAMTRGLGAAATSKGRRYAAFKEAYSMSDTDMKVFARDLGIIFESFQYALQNSAEEGAHFKYEKWNNIFFRANLLQPLTEAQQAAALAAAVRVLPTWRKKALQGSNMHKRWLTEVGLTEQDLDMFNPKHAMASANPKVRAALRQIVNETIMNPDPGRKPAWMSDPRFALVAHIKSWIFTFNNTVLQRTAREVTKGNVMPLIYLAGFGALNAVMYEMKEWLRYGEEGNPYLNRIGLEKDNPYRFLFLALERGGLFGPAQFAVDTILGTRVGTGGSDIAGALVPSYNLANRALNGVAYIIDAPFSENPDKKFRRGVDELSRLVPGLNAAGQFRSDFVTQITGVEPGRRKRGSGISRSGSGGSVSRGVSR